MASADWSDPETLETLRLCLCKACKTEAWSNVDISKLRRSTSPRSTGGKRGAPCWSAPRSSTRALNRLGSGTHAIANAINGTRMRAGRAATIGSPGWLIRTSQRSLHAWFAERRRCGSRRPRRAASLPSPAADADRRSSPTASPSTTSRTRAAAIRVLEASATSVLLPGERGTATLTGSGRVTGFGGVGCCGRSPTSACRSRRLDVGRKATAAGKQTCRMHAAVAVVGCERASGKRHRTTGSSCA
ncbi:MAG: hypothetical protein U0575_02745 [Phycisphaerales bacterium]